MEDNKKQIEEMSNLINKNLFNYLNQDNLSCKDVCDLLANDLLKYYQPKLPEDSVALSKEEYEEYQDLLKNFDNYLFEYRKFADKCIENKGKETAEKIYLQAKAVVDATKHIVQGRKYLHIDALKEIVKSCGVEIKE